MIDIKHLFFSVVSFAAGPRALALVSFGVCHTGALYVIAGRIISVYLPCLVKCGPPFGHILSVHILLKYRV